MKKVAFVTGASGDIGRACAIQLANDGYSVAVGFNSDEASANELSAQLKGCGHEAITVACDVCSGPGITAAVSLICKELGSIDVLVNNAGIADIRLFTDNSFEDIQRMINTDLIGAMELSRQVLPDMIRKKSGCIIMICTQKTSTTADRLSYEKNMHRNSGTCRCRKNYAFRSSSV